ncbi:MAG: hypothetical protein J1F68_02485 [Clostridiales bacterium]|nr:hypothetical protein [Clostridiales bacterium]
MNITEKRILSSIPINSINNNAPLSNASGCFIDYRGHTFFLTVYHTVSNNNLTNGIVVDFDPSKGVCLAQLTVFCPFIRGNILTKEVDEVDFACREIDTMPPCQYFEVDSYGKIIRRTPRIKLISDLTDLPSKNEEYGFAGYIYGNLTGNPLVNAKFKYVWNQELGYYEGLKYVCSKGDYHLFSLPNTRDYDADDFKGTSGAPILDSQGKLVALVACGYLSNDGKEWIIKGFNLAKYKDIIDIECGLL